MVFHRSVHADVQNLLDNSPHVVSQYRDLDSLYVVHVQSISSHLHCRCCARDRYYSVQLL